MYMLDTNVIIYAMRHPKSGVNDILQEHIGKDVFISAITFAELEYGIEKSAKPEKNRLAVQRILANIPVLDFDINAAKHFGDIFSRLEQEKRRIGDRDTLIAAHARSLGYTIVTHNTREFQRVENLVVEDWLEQFLL